jgi:sulfonate transport system ATP-binding protein
VLAVEGLARCFEDGFAALGPVDLALAEGELVAVLGPSGAGKSTLLRLLAGLDRPTAGCAWFDGQPIDGPRDEVAVVFQEPRLMPWLSVEGNVGFALWQMPARERTARVQAAVERVGLAAFARALPKQLSGGMAQRTALARALVTRPKMLLMDEPFSALDPLTRERQQDHLIDVLGREHPTVLFITHDIDEALALADRVVLLAGPPGHIVLDQPVDLSRPRDRLGEAFQALHRRLRLALDAAAPSFGDACPQSSGGGTKPPNSRSIIPAKAIVVRSSR